MSLTPEQYLALSTLAYQDLRGSLHPGLSSHYQMCQWVGFLV